MSAVNLTGIRYFISIAEEGGISAAARKLYISQQALSEHLKKLEAEAGAALVRRSPFGLTDAGERFYEGCKKLLNVYGEMMDDIGRIAEKRRDKITLGVPTFGAPPYLLDFLGRFQISHPEYEIAIVKRQHDDVARSMGGVDLYLSYLPLSDELENHILLENDPYHVTFQSSLAERIYGSEWKQIEEALNRTGDLSLLRDMPFIILRDRYDRMAPDLRRIFAEHDFDPIVSFNSENSELNNKTCLNGLGCLLAPKSTVDRRFYGNRSLDTRELLSYPIRVTSFAPKLAVSCEKGKRLPGTARCFIRELTEFIQAGE